MAKKVKVLVSQSDPTLCDSMDSSLPGSSNHGINSSGKNIEGGLPFPSPGYLPNPGIKPGSPALQVDSLPSEPPGKPHRWQKTLKLRDSLSGK